MAEHAFAARSTNDGRDGLFLVAGGQEQDDRAPAAVRRRPQGWLRAGGGAEPQLSDQRRRWVHDGQAAHHERVGGLHGVRSDGGRKRKGAVGSVGDERGGGHRLVRADAPRGDRDDLGRDS